MRTTSNERLFRTVGACLTVVAAALTLVVDENAELPLFMATAVMASLACFDAALDRANRSFWPWLLLSVSILVKAAPRVSYDLASEGSVSLDRYDDVGAVLAGICVLAALVSLAAAPRLLADGSPRVRSLTVPVIAISAVIGGVAGASIAFVEDLGFASVRSARIFETAGWALGAGIAAAAVVATFTALRIRRALAIVLVGAISVSALNLLTAAGHDLDIGWWALGWAVFAVGALAPKRSLLGEREERIVSSWARSAVCVVAAVGALGAALWLTSTPSSWKPGQVALFVLAAVSVAVGYVVRPPLRVASESSSAIRGKAGEVVVGAVPEAAVTATDSSPAIAPNEANRSTSNRSASNRSTSIWATALADDEAPADDAANGTFTGGSLEVPSFIFGSGTFGSGVDDPDGLDIEPDEFTIAARIIDSPETVADTVHSDGVSTSTAGVGQMTEADTSVDSADHSETAGPTDGPTDETAPDPDNRDRQVAAPFNAAQQAESLRLVEGLAHHHYDPATGLLSGNGLQIVVGRAFDAPSRAASQVALVLVGVRNADAIEADFGRIATEALHHQLAHRLRAAVPTAVCARFSRNGYAALLTNLDGDADTAVAQFTEALVSLLDPVVLGSSLVDVDVAGGMAVNHENEPAASLVDRANTGLARATESEEPTLVTMP